MGPHARDSTHPLGRAGSSPSGPAGTRPGARSLWAIYDEVTRLDGLPGPPDPADFPDDLPPDDGEDLPWDGSSSS